MLFSLQPLFCDQGPGSIWRFCASMFPPFNRVQECALMLCILFLPHYDQEDTLSRTKNPVVRPDLFDCILLCIVLFSIVFSSTISLPGLMVWWLVLRKGDGGRECGQEGVWVMLCLFLQPAITWLNCLLDCCVPALGEATMPCLFVYESLWLWLAASSSAAEHTIGTKGGEKNPATVSHWKAFTVKLGHPTVGHRRTEAGKG